VILPTLILTLHSGIGMTAESQRVIFEPFYQADCSIARKFGGTGLMGVDWTYHIRIRIAY
jgi:signal transduction histidine kinase